MTRLLVTPDHAPGVLVLDTRDPGQIADALKAVGVRFEQWGVRQGMDDVMAGYAGEIERLKREGGYVTVDSISMHPDHPQKKELREKFLREHTHSEDEVRFFVQGQAVFYLHLENHVYALLCCAGDLFSVPAGTPHWFDMGEKPEFTALRFFCNPEGWVARYTDQPIADSFPRYEYYAVK